MSFPLLIDYNAAMSHGHKFDPKKKANLKDPERLAREDPELIWKTLALRRPQRFVDIGCGVGYAAIPFARKMPDGVVYACDISMEMLDALGGELETEKAGNIVPLHMEEVAVPLEDGLADCVYSQNIYHEFHRLDESLAEFMRLLKPGGLLAIIDWKPGDTPHGPPQEVRVSAEQIISDCAAAGYIDLTPHDVLPYHSFVTGRKPPRV